MTAGISDGQTRIGSGHLSAPDPRVLVMIAAHNEEENIRGVVRELESKAPYADYLVINDGSSDRTEMICVENHFQYVSLPVNLGIGGAVQTGYRYALENGYDIAVQLDGDGQHDPDYLAAVIRPIEEGRADYVIGSRFIADVAGQKDPGGQEGFRSTGARRAGIRFLSALIHLCCGQKIYDVTSGFRAVGRESIIVFADQYPIDYPEPEAIIDAVLRGERVMEVPVIMREREHGESSINVRRSIYYMIKVSLDILICRISYGLRRDRNRKNRRPDLKTGKARRN